MNERINQLRLEAGISRLHDEPKFMVAVSKEGTVIEPLDGLEKFAELIVRECVELSVNSQYVNTKSEYYEGFNEALIYASNKIKKHFGVEE